MYHTTVIKTPALVFVSKNDPVGSVTANQQVRDIWESTGQKVSRFQLFAGHPLLSIVPV